MAGSTFQTPSKRAKGNDLIDLMQRFTASLAEFSQRSPFSINLQNAPDQQRRQQVRHSSSSNLNNNAQLGASLRASEICTSSGNSRAQCVVSDLFQPGELSVEQLVRHKLSEGREIEIPYPVQTTFRSCTPLLPLFILLFYALPVAVYAYLRLFGAGEDHRRFSSCFDSIESKA